MDSWERFYEASLPKKEYFYNNLIIEDITDADYRHYRHAKRVWKYFKIKI